jgi:hypothetical protein
MILHVSPMSEKVREMWWQATQRHTREKITLIFSLTGERRAKRENNVCDIESLKISFIFFLVYLSHDSRASFRRVWEISSFSSPPSRVSHENGKKKYTFFSLLKCHFKSFSHFVRLRLRDKSLSKKKRKKNGTWNKS